jgi:hypothetical protein
MPRALDLTGQTFGRFIAREPIRHLGLRAWLCDCVCGNTSRVLTRDLTKGNSRSCGCAQATQGGQSKSRAYIAWRNMLMRCTNPSHPQYDNYGGRGIKVCRRWKSYINFREDMGQPPLGLTLERKNNVKGYNPGNCMWATYAAQARNKRVTRMITYKGETMCIIDWARRLGIDGTTLQQRLAKGMKPRQAFTAPIRGKG